MVFIFDFDYTLFDTGQYKKDFKDFLFSTYNITEELFKKDYKSCFAKGDVCYDLKKHMRLLGIDPGDSNFTTFFNDQNHYLFQEMDCLVRGVAAKEANYVLLLTRGHYETQMLKLQAVSIKDFFDEIVIIEETKEEWIQHYRLNDKTVIFINDKPQENSDVQKKIPHADIFLVEGPYAYKGNKSQKVYTRQELVDTFQAKGWV